MDFLDTYSLKARLFPAVLTIAPALILCLLSARWVDPGPPEFIATVSVMVLFFAASNLARRFGRAKEREIFASTGGIPPNAELTHADSTFSSSQKTRYRKYLAEKLGLMPPTAEDELMRPKAAQEFYNQAYAYVRENTRDAEKFRLLFNENIAYGYYRNLLGLKKIGITMNLLSLGAAVVIVFLKPEFAQLSHGKLVALCGLSAVHLMYFVFAVNRRAVFDASAIYARQLVLSIETLMKQDNAK